jgi:hypothetical protein
MANAFQFRVFDARGEGEPAITVSTEVLHAQGNLQGVLDALTTRFTETPTHWQQILKIEETEPFSLDVKCMGNDAMFAHLARGKSHYMVVALAPATSSLEQDHLVSVQAIIEKMEATGGMEGAFDWLTGVPPPLAALMALDGPKPAVGIQMLAMCVADRFFHAVPSTKSRL